MEVPPQPATAAKVVVGILPFVVHLDHLSFIESQSKAFAPATYFCPGFWKHSPQQIGVHLATFGEQMQNLLSLLVLRKAGVVSYLRVGFVDGLLEEGGCFLYR